MRRFVLAALVVLSGAGAAVAADFIIPVDKDFWDDDITWNSMGKAYEFKWVVGENKTGLYVCGVGKFLDASTRSNTIEVLRKATVNVDGKMFMKDLTYFGKIKKGEDLNSAKAVCRQTATKWPKGAEGVSIEFSGRYRF